MGKVGINLGGYGIFLGDKGSFSVYTFTGQNWMPNGPEVPTGTSQYTT